MTLTPGHREDLRRSGLTDETIASAGIFSAAEHGVRDLLGYGAGPGLVFPYAPLNGGAPYARVKIDHPGPDGKRYRSPKGQPNRLYVPRLLDPAILADPSTPLWITEGEKKALKTCQEGDGPPRGSGEEQSATLPLGAARAGRADSRRSEPAEALGNAGYPQDEEDCSEAARADLAGAPEPVLSSPGPTCPVCQAPIPEGRETCSGKCRAALSRKRRAEELEARVRRLRGLLEAALRELDDYDSRRKAEKKT